MKQNPKMVGTKLIDCVPQKGPCPNNCNQCYYNKSFYAGHEPFIPTLEEAAGKIVRVNSGHDSNIQKELVLEKTRHFPNRFYNTSIPNLDFENAPVVLTVNPEEDTSWVAMEWPDNLMYVRFRLNMWNVDIAKKVIRHYTELNIPVVLTFMRYYHRKFVVEPDYYERRMHISHEYWSIKESTWFWIMSDIGRHGLVYPCGTPQSPYCRDCSVCETLYWRLFIVEGREGAIMEDIPHGN
jgi:hypothetical protein